MPERQRWSENEGGRDKAEREVERVEEYNKTRNGAMVLAWS